MMQYEALRDGWAVLNSQSMFSSLWILYPNSWHLSVGKHIRGHLAQIVITYSLIPLIRKVRKECGSFQRQRCARTFGHFLPHAQCLAQTCVGADPWEEPSVPYTVPLWLTFGGPGAALPRHGTVLLVFVSAHTQEGPLHVFTEGFATHATEQFTLIHIWKKERRSSQTQMNASLRTALCFTSCAKASSVCWKQGVPVCHFWERAPKGTLTIWFIWKGSWKSKARDPNSNSGFKKHP